MVRGTSSAVLGLLLLAGPTPVSAGGPAGLIDVPSGPMATSLQRLARSTGAELLYDRDVVAGISTPSLHGRFTLELALRRLLANTGLTVRRAASGAWVIEADRTATTAAPDLAVPEILIVGRRSENVDIPRSENDIQPYRVTTQAQLISAHRDTVDQYFGSRVTENTQAIPPSLLGQGQTNSAIDLRGLGTDGTLVLVDGRRMPGMPVSPPQLSTLGDPPHLELMQPDLNAIPLHAIERIETLTGTAGGIYGFGALGGVVNVVLKRDYRGIDLHATGGISSRGDATRYGIEGRIGFTPDHGDTDVMLFFSHFRTQPLRQGQRDFRVRDRNDALRVQGNTILANPFNENGVGVFDASNLYADPPMPQPLVLKPAFGGTSIGSSFTFLPPGFAGTLAEAASALTQRAGKYDLGLTADEASDEVGAHAHTNSLIADVRHRFSANVEAYAQALILRNTGESVTRSDFSSIIMPANDARNPFDNTVWVSFPTPATRQDYHVALSSERYTAGLIGSLPADWQATVEATFSVSRNQGTIVYRGFDPQIGFPDVNPITDWKGLQRAFLSIPYDLDAIARSSNHSREQSLRLAGPLITTSGGPATLTLLAEHRHEEAPAFNATTRGAYNADTPVGARHSDTTSFYAELRTRLFGDSAPLPFLRNFELQFAARHDRQALDAFPAQVGVFPDVPAETHPLHVKFEGTNFTAGAKLFLLPRVMLRGSYATGEQEPQLSSLFPIESDVLGLYVTDPKRGNEFPFNTDKIRFLSGGSPDLKTVKANTVSVGLVVNPLADQGPRVSVDYSRINKKRDVYVLTNDLLGGGQVVIDHEDYWPQRVVRAPLTDADRALGYTGGVITLFDARATNGASTIAESLNGRADWTFPILGGVLHTYTGATLQIRNARRTLFDPTTSQIGYLGGPLKWRANGGADWSAGSMSVGANLQYFGPYRIYTAAMATSSDPVLQLEKSLLLGAQGAPRIRAQVYLDLYITKHYRAGSHEISLDLGVVNVLDAAPLREANEILVGASYSRYGDPRRRRFELAVSAGF